MKRLLWLLVVADIVAMVWALPRVVSAQMPQDLVYVQPANGFAPLVLILRGQLPDHAQLCTEVRAGLMPCRSVFEIRQFLYERPASPTQQMRK